MTRDDVIRMARKAGMSGMLTDVICQFSELERFAALAAAAEREECAKVCAVKGAIKYAGLTIGEQCAAAIRARGTK